MIVLEETYEKLNCMWMQKKKTLVNMETEIRVNNIQTPVDITKFN